jgi:hypothetical protein
VDSLKVALPCCFYLRPSAFNLKESKVVDIDRFGVVPEAFQIVKFPLIVVKNMNDYVIKVKENPHPFLKAFGMGGGNSFGTHLAFNGLGQALDMAG